MYPANILVSRYVYEKLKRFIRILEDRKLRGYQWLWLAADGMLVSQKPHIKGGVLWDCGRYEILPKTNRCINALSTLGLMDDFITTENSISIDDVLTRWSTTKLTYL
jgi:hypothetical protein